MTTGPHVVVEADGGARGNPGPAGYGAVVRDAGTGEVLAERSAAIGVATNNIAEYSGLVAGLAAAAELGAGEVDVRMDSKLVVEQMAGRWKIKNAGLRPLAAEAATLARRFTAVRFTWIPRERNRHADALANAAMDAAAGKGSRSGSTAEADPDPEGAPAVGSGAGSGTGGSAPTSSTRPGGRWQPATGPALRMVLLRHGETEFTVQRRYSGRGDVPLTVQGQAQAAAAASRVAELTDAAVSLVLTSPLGRCRQTAAAVAAATGAELIVEPDLIECDFGAWEGLTFTDVRARFPAELDAWLDSPAVAPPGGESFRAVTMRVRRLVAALRERHAEQNVVLVSHVSPIKLLLRDALAAGDAFLHRCYLDPAGISVVDAYADGAVAVRTVNDTAHLARLA